jgi:hypothetical protein
MRFETTFFGQIDRAAKQISNLVFHADDIQKRNPARIVEGGQQIDIGIRPGITPSCGAEQRQTHDTGLFQFPFVGAKLGQHVLPVHAFSVTGRSCLVKGVHRFKAGSPHFAVISPTAPGKA